MIDFSLLLFFAFLLVYYTVFLIRIIVGIRIVEKSTGNNEIDEFVSVIIPFRNESDNILNCLRSLEQQCYPLEKFEVIFVDDFSTDGSREVLENEIKSPNIKMLKFENYNSLMAYKKQAVKFGIENSSGKIIVTTDADCTQGKYWLKTILEYFDDDTALVSGPVEFESDGSLFSNLQKIEFAGLILTGAGLIGSGKPIICNGANLAYRKKIFEEVGGFSDQILLSSGEDELLMQKIKRDTKDKIKFCWNKEGIVKTKSNTTIKEFYYQRKRWASKGMFYRDKKIIGELILIFLFYLNLILQLLLGIFSSKLFLLTFIISLLIKSLLEFIILKKGKENLFNTLKLIYFFPAEILHIPYILISAVSGLFGNFIWKERNLKR